ncbi:MAG: hypothetical protein ACRDSK_27750 [Actinophytocola sp.]|uniref:hypothetical protein n=1 Tax=Actinophytocola sp. TaxID=1872138 RepID=UPI003D6BA735
MRDGSRWVGVAAAVFVLAGCAADPGPAAPADDCVKIVEEGGTETDRCLPLAPEDGRVDTGTPRFGNPLRVTNPLHPTGIVRQTIYGGQVDGKPFRTEVTLLPERKIINWGGHRIDALESQYFALSDGRIKEVALDWYAQADDGSVWYLGEDVFNYEDGEVVDTDGTWVAGADAPAAMIMPAHPAKGDVYRPENKPGVVFEEVTVSATNQTVDGPSGPIEGAITVSELHMDGSREDKTFAPGYGEFSTGNADGDHEAASLALPADATNAPVPPTVDALATAIRRATDAVAGADWAAADTATAAVAKAWTAARPEDAPLPLLTRQMDRDIDTLTTAVSQRDAGGARDAALRVAQNELDVRSRHEAVDPTRVALWARQLVIDAAADDQAAVAGDLASLKWTFDRIRGDVPDPAAVHRTLTALGEAVEQGDLAAAATEARKLG